MEVGDIRAKFENFGAVCVEVDAHDLEGLRDARREAEELRIYVERSSQS